MAHVPVVFGVVIPCVVDASAEEVFNGSERALC